MSAHLISKRKLSKNPPESSMKHVNRLKTETHSSSHIPTTI